MNLNSVLFLSCTFYGSLYLWLSVSENKVFNSLLSIYPSFPVGNGPDWAKDLKSSDFELLCQDGTTQPVTKFSECHLGKVAANAVITRPETRGDVVSILLELQVGVKTYSQIWFYLRQLLSRFSQG